MDATLDGLDEVETKLRDHFETKRFAFVGPGRDSEAMRREAHKRLPQAEQAIHMSDLDRAGTNGVTSPAVTPDSVTVTNQSMLSRNLGCCAVLLVCWDIWQRTYSTLSRTS